MGKHPRGKVAWEATMSLLALVSVGLMFWHDRAEQPWRQRIVWADLVIVLLFLADWVSDVRSAAKPGRYAFTHSWELLGMVPLAIGTSIGGHDVAALRLLRLLRLVRILRVLAFAGRFIEAAESVVRQGQVLKLAVVSGAVTVTGALLVWLAERGTNAGLATFGEAMWWAVVTVTTVGYGDVTPHTVVGRFVAGGLMVCGIGTIALLASTLASTFIERKANAGPSEPARGIVRDLEILAGLHAAGKLTDAEYAAAKGRLLATEAP